MKHTTQHIALTLLLFLMLFGLNSWGQQNQYGQTIIDDISGTKIINASILWQDTAYEVRYNIEIKNGATLTISPQASSNRGINIYMAQGTKISVVEGGLKSIGSSGKMIKFTTHNPFIPATSSNTWFGFEFDANIYTFNGTPDAYHLNSFSSEINYSIVEYTNSTQPTGGVCGGTFEQTKTSIDLSSFESGCYLIKITTQKQTIVQKIIKN